MSERPEVEQIGWEEFRKQNGWPTPHHMRRAADALDVLTPAKYGDVLRWVADACDDALDSPALRAAAPAPPEPIVRFREDADLATENAAIKAGTHEPAVDDFGNQYLSPLPAAPPEPDPLSPQWEDCKVCGGDHWTKDHPATSAPPEPERNGWWTYHVCGATRREVTAESHDGGTITAVRCPACGEWFEGHVSPGWAGRPQSPPDAGDA